MQLDLFLDGKETLLVNDLVTKILERCPAHAERALHQLREQSPQHPDLGAFECLVHSFRAGPPVAPDAIQLGPTIDSMAALAPAAERLLGRRAAVFLLGWWRALARTEALPGPGEPAPLPRYWIGCARWNVGDERQALRLWLPLCWLAPESFVRQAPTLPSRTLREGWSTFDSEAEAEENGDVRAGRIAWFPAWLALQHRWIAHLFPPDEVPETSAALRAFRLLPGLFVLESRGYGEALIEQRRALRDISPPFFRRYWQLVVEAGGRAT
jgi:hypothetical protein